MVLDAMPTPTNSELAHKIDDVDKNQRSFQRFIKRDIVPKVNAMHDYIIGQEAIKNQSKGQGFNITPDIIKIILWLVAIIAALVGVTKLPQ